MKENGKNTPGPWQVGHGEADGGYLGIWASDNRTVVCRVSPADLINETDEVNALLIAAAPDLLSACKDALVSIVANMPWEKATVIRSTLQAAIDKAEGGAS